VAGRPSKRTPERREVILRAIRTGQTETAAAGMADMDRSTMLRWAKSDASFRAALALAHATAEARFTSVVTDDAFGRPAQYDDDHNLIRAEVKPNVATAQWWLQHRRRQEYGQHITMDVRGIAKKVADEYGLDVADVLAEAEAILQGD